MEKHFTLMPWKPCVCWNGTNTTQLSSVTKPNTANPMLNKAAQSDNTSAIRICNKQASFSNAPQKQYFNYTHYLAWYYCNKVPRRKTFHRWNEWINKWMNHEQSGIETISCNIHTYITINFIKAIHSHTTASHSWHRFLRNCIFGGFTKLYQESFD